jgi:hypothetical protein
LAANPKRLGAQLGMLGVLHTWSRTLIFHPHIHYLIPGGGLSPDQRQWIARSPKFLFHETPLGQHFRTLYRQALQERAPEALKELPDKIWKQHWRVDCEAVGSGEKALAYLARYVFKTATGNRQLQRLPSGKVLWPYRDSKTHQQKSLPLTPTELIRRFLQHVLPQGFCRVRLFGWLHPAGRLRGNRVRALLQVAPLLTQPERQSWQKVPTTDPPLAPPPKPLCRCPRCGAVLRLVGAWRAGQKPPTPTQERAP